MYSPLSTAIAKTGFDQDLKALNGATFFAPLANAFDEAGINVNSASVAELRDFLGLHIIPKTLDVPQIKGKITMLNGDTINFTQGEDGRIFANGNFVWYFFSVKAGTGRVLLAYTPVTK